MSGNFGGSLSGNVIQSKHSDRSKPNKNRLPKPYGNRKSIYFYQSDYSDSG
jgi:hypothetical protein